MVRKIEDLFSDSSSEESSDDLSETTDDSSNSDHSDHSDTESDDVVDDNTVAAHDALVAQDNEKENDPFVLPEAMQNQDVQHAMHLMLGELQTWWISSEKLLSEISQNKLDCSRISGLSDEIDTMLDKGLEALMTDMDSNPELFPVQTLVRLCKTMKQVVFTTLGQMCCRSDSDMNKCVRVAKKSLETLKRFRESTSAFHDVLLAARPQQHEDDQSVMSDDLKELLEQLGLRDIYDEEASNIVAN